MRVNAVFQEEEFSEKKFSLKLWLRVLKDVREVWKYLVGVVIFMSSCALLDVIFPLLTRYAIDTFVTPGVTEGLGGFAALYIGLALVQAVAIGMFIFCAARAETGTVYRIRHMGFQKLQSQSYAYFDRTPVGFIMARMTSDAQRMGDTVAWALVDLVYGLAFMVMSMVAMLILNWKLALAAFAVLPFVYFISRYFQTRILRHYREVRKTNSRITGAFNEGIMGAKTTKTLVREERNCEEFGELTQIMRKSSIRAAIMSALFMPIVMSLGAIGTAIALWWGGSDVIAGTLTYGTLMAFITYTTQFFEPVREIARIMAEMQSAQAAAERVISLIDSEPEVTDGLEIEAVYGDCFTPKRENWPAIEGDIRFENVSFAYKGGERVLSDFNLHLHAGETIALVGETGSGKSTIVNLICRFYEPTEGRILIDGVDYRQRSQLWLQSNLGYVLQTPHLFSGSIADNIRYGQLEASDAEVERAARMVGAHPFIESLDNGYATQVGEGGNRLSTGQKQLISFARAILANPRIFVLDEATSSIDTETEQLIQQAIQTVLEGRTSFIIAHRLSTIRNADRILVIDHGEVLESGTHHELMEQGGHYYRLYTRQFVQEQEERILGGLGAEEA